MTYSTTFVTAGLMGWVGMTCGEALAAPETFEFFFKASDTTLTPGETLKFELWGRLKPGVGEAAILNVFGGTKPESATVGWFTTVDFDLWTLSTPGNWLSIKKNPDPNYLALQSPGTPYQYGVMDINLTNKGLQATEFLMYSYVWEPQNYDPQTMTLTILSSPPKVTLIRDQNGLPFTETWAWYVDELVITIGATCTADCDTSGTLDIDDFICFQTNFALGDIAADCDASGQLDIDDFICFQTAFALGC